MSIAEKTDLKKLAQSVGRIPDATESTTLLIRSLNEGYRVISDRMRAALSAGAYSEANKLQLDLDQYVNQVGENEQTLAEAVTENTISARAQSGRASGQGT